MSLQLPECKNPKVPAAEYPFKHQTRLQVRFSDIDMLGHINNSVYISFFDLAKAKYFTEATSSKIEIGGIAVVIVNVNCSFYSPGYFNEPLEAVTTVTRASHRSINLEQRIFNSATGDVKCIATTVMAGFDTRTALGAEIPYQFIEEIEAYEQRKILVEKNI